MAMVPVFDQPQVRDQALPQVREENVATTSTFGGGPTLDSTTQAVVGTADTAQKIFDQERKKADNLALTDFNTKLTQLKNSLIYDPKSGLMTRKGKDAFGAPEEFGTQFDQGVETLKGSLSNDEQRQMATHYVAQHKAELDTDIQKHVFAESKAFDNETTESGIAAAQDDATLNYHEPEKISNAIATQKAIIMDYAARNGLPPEAVKMKLEEAASKTHGEVIKRMLANGEDQNASEYYKQIKSDVSGADSIHLEKSLEEGSVRGQSQRISDDIMTKGLSMSAALDQARKIQDPKIRDATVDRVRDQFTQADAARRDAQEKISQSAGNIIDKTGSIDDVPPNQWTALSIAEKSALKSYAKMKSEGTAVATNWDDFYNLKTLASAPATRDAFMKTNLMEYRDKLADGEFKQMVDLQSSLRSGDGKAAEHLDGFRSDQDIVNGVLSDAGINHNAKPGSDEAKRVNLFKSKVDKEVMKIQDRTGKKVTNADIKQISDNLMVEGATDNGLFGSGWFASKKRAFEVPTDATQFVIDTKSIPQDEKDKAGAALRARGIPVTDQKILELYKRKLGGVVRGQ